ncbi:MAG: alcohol dehydrogenase catalytic domain-containing protein, partial [Siphonobacter aquaeclarae]|nr:alcohol dehydrogenase catalytic domain-containing protein [Siphonobacter aquaeclarae]
MIPKTMKAAVLRAFGAPLAIEEVPVREPGENQVLVKIITSGVCHTDLHACEGDWPVKPKLPLIPGHEGVGYVVALGRGVDQVKEGDIVGVPWLFSACGTCEYCITGWETLCESQQNGGYSVDGSYAEYVVADARYVAHFPAGFFPAVGAGIFLAGVDRQVSAKLTGQFQLVVCHVDCRDVQTHGFGILNRQV